MKIKRWETMREYNKDSLLSKMERCGHFLYHRRGKDRGQGKILIFSLVHDLSLYDDIENDRIFPFC